MSGVRAVVDPDLADEVAAFLRRHPFFLADNPDLYQVLQPPERVHGERLADHMAAMIRASRAHAAEYAARADSVLAAGRVAAGLGHQVQEAVLSLMVADDPVEWIRDELPAKLGLDSATLCVERFLAGARRVPTGTVARLMGRRDVVFRERPADAALLHAEAAPLAQRDALVRIQGATALIALASRDPSALPTGQGIAALAFLGRAVGAALRLA
jgi:uncharacterized protein YigA (DUF484 family)